MTKAQPKRTTGRNLDTRLKQRRKLTRGMEPDDKKRYRIAGVVLATVKDHFMEHSRFFNVDIRVHRVIRMCISHILGGYGVNTIDNAYAVGVASHSIIGANRLQWAVLASDHVFGDDRYLAHFGNKTKAEIETIIRESLERNGIANAVKDWVPYVPDETEEMEDSDESHS